MSYTLRLEQTHILTYNQNVGLVAQQLTNPIENAVTIVPASGEALRASSLVGQVEYMREEPRSRQNPENPAQATSRWLTFQPRIETGQVIDTEDKLKMAMDPTSILLREHVAAIKRGRADLMFGVKKTEAGYVLDGGGILGNTREGKTPGGAATALPNSQYVSTGTGGLTLDDLRAAVKMLKKADFGIDSQMDPLYGAITPEQEDDLLGIAAASGVALNAFTIEQLKSGKPTMLMGINWILTNRLPIGASGAAGAGKRLCPIWAKSNIIVGEWEGIFSDAWPLPHAKNLPYIYAATRIDALRAQDKGVVVIPCTE